MGQVTIIIVVSCYGTLDISASYKNGTHPGILQGTWPTTSFLPLRLQHNGHVLILLTI